ncbi:hypothetical protein C8F04DRAFT_1236915 [Mycena alexandri]|uniref:Uncharacterized protein n=1 Tax=Mycena alexandri TaxID=1745969 RepID=A0AAD6SLQ4_9AGAR|nr:hypothetical protein C8F04DRAFT_1236915 [Mycena alexandri]
MGKSHQDWRTRPDLESNEGLAFQYYEENTVNVRVTKHGTVNIADTEYCTEYGKCRHAAQIKATEGGASYGVRKLGAQAATLQSVAPPSVGPTKVKLDRSFNQGGLTSQKELWKTSALIACVVVERAAKLPNGQQPNLAACNHWLGPRTVEKKPGYEGLRYNPSEDTACPTYTRQGDKKRNHIAQASQHGTAFILRSVALRTSVENPPIEAFLEG